MCSDLHQLSQCCTYYSIIGIVFTAWVGFMIEKQPFFIKHINTTEQEEQCKNSAFGATGVFVVTLILSILYLIRDRVIRSQSFNTMSSLATSEFFTDEAAAAATNSQHDNNDDDDVLFEGLMGSNPTSDISEVLVGGGIIHRGQQRNNKNNNNGAASGGGGVQIILGSSDDSSHHHQSRGGFLT